MRFNQGFDYQGRIPNGSDYLPTTCSKPGRLTEQLPKYMTSAPPATKAPSNTSTTHPGECQLPQRALR
jgi:hypothetical protein